MFNVLEPKNHVITLFQNIPATEILSLHVEMSTLCDAIYLSLIPLLLEPDPLTFHSFNETLIEHLKILPNYILLPTLITPATGVVSPECKVTKIVHH